jgi:flagellar basal-body rod protein FlgB
MSTQDLALFKGLGAKMQYLNHRQRVIAQNVANSDTPDYRPQDLTKVNFDMILKQIENKTHTPASSLRLETTKDGHMPPGGELNEADERKQKQVYEVAPVGNAVVIEEQLIMAQETVMDYNLLSNLYQKNVGMIYTALGRN